MCVISTAGLMSGKVEPIDTPPGKESFHTLLSIEDDSIIKKIDTLM